MNLSIVFAVTVLFSISTMAADLESRLALLENKVQALEKGLHQRLGNCSLTYKRHGYRLNICDEGTFAHSVTSVGGSSLQLECGYYQLECSEN